MNWRGLVAPVKLRLTRPRVLAHGALLAVVTLWSVNNVAVKVGLLYMKPLDFIVVRFLIAGSTLLLISIAQHRHLVRPPPLSRLIPAALVGVTANQLCYTYGLQLTTAVNVSLILGLSPIAAAILLIVVDRRLPSLHQFVAVCLGFVGLVLVLGGSQGVGSVVGDLIAVGNPITWALYTVIADRWAHRIPVVTFTAWTMLLGALGFTPTLLFVGDLLKTDWQNVAVPLAFSAIFATGLGYAAYFWALPRLGVAPTTIYIYLPPVMGAAAGALLLHEPFGVLQALGAVIILAAAYAGSWRVAPP